MATVKRFYDLEVWKKARSLNSEIYKITLDEKLKKDFVLVDQIRRASISIMANIAEGFGRQGNKEFINFLSIAQASATELQSHLYIMSDVSYITREKFDEIFFITEEVHRMINKLVNYLKDSELKGIKYA